MEAKIKQIIEFRYTPELAENDEETITGVEILELCKGNVQYCLAIMNRIEWQHPATLIDEDLNEGEIILVEGQYVMTNGKELSIIEESEEETSLPKYLHKFILEANLSYEDIYMRKYSNSIINELDNYLHLFLAFDEDTTDEEYDDLMNEVVNLIKN